MSAVIIPFPAAPKPPPTDPAEAALCGFVEAIRRHVIRRGGIWDHVSEDKVRRLAQLFSEATPRCRQ